MHHIDTKGRHFQIISAGLAEDLQNGTFDRAETWGMTTRKLRSVGLSQSLEFRTFFPTGALVTHALGGSQSDQVPSQRPTRTKARQWFDIAVVDGVSF
jgi:hypothetical protein